jgi:hypothetical protein
VRKKKTKEGKDPIEEDPLFAEWNRVAEVGKGNPCLETSRIFERNKDQLRQLRRIAKHLEARDATWDGLLAGFEAYEQDPSLQNPKNCTYKRLAADESVVAALLKAGANGHSVPTFELKEERRGC